MWSHQEFDCYRITKHFSNSFKYDELLFRYYCIIFSKTVESSSLVSVDILCLSLFYYYYLDYATSVHRHLKRSNKHTNNIWSRIHIYMSMRHVALYEILCTKDGWTEQRKLCHTRQIYLNPSQLHIPASAGSLSNYLAEKLPKMWKGLNPALTSNQALDIQMNQYDAPTLATLSW